MTPHDYINQLLSFPTTNADPYSDAREPLADRIYRIVTRSAMRSAKVDVETEKMLRDKVAESIKKNQPIRFHIGMGGGKGINLEGHPSINWAEVFHLAFMYEGYNMIALVHEPGVIVEYATDDYGAEWMNGYTPEDMQVYRDDFGLLLEKVNAVALPNFAFSLKSCRDFYPDRNGAPREVTPNKDEMHEEVMEEVARLEQNSEEADKIIADWSARARNNLVPFDGETADQFETRVKRSTLVNMAWLTVDEKYRAEWLFGGINIPVGHFAAFPGTFLMQVVRGSVVQFWKGNGYLECRNDKCTPRIVSRKVLAQKEPELERVPIEHEMTSQFATLSELPVLRS